MASRAVSVAALTRAVPGMTVIGSANSVVSGISYDSRTVQHGDLFAALPGTDFDGHLFAEDAERRGAAALLVERSVESGLPQLVVADCRRALAAVSAAFYRYPSDEIGVIGITGTDGKTTTSYLVDHLLQCAGRRTGMIGTVTIRVGDREELHETRQTTPESSDIQRYLRAMVDAGADWAILEATSHGLSMHRLDGVRFGIGAVTNITHEHLDFHGSLDAYRRAKALLVERTAGEDGIVIVNADDAGAVAVLPFAAGATIVRYSMSGAAAELQAQEIRSNPSGSRFILDAGGDGRVPIDLPYLGGFNVANALCAAGIALAAGAALSDIAKALTTAPPVPGRMARVDAGQPFSVVVDYAHTPDSMEKVLRLLRELHPRGRLVVVFGSAGERDRKKRPLQGATAARLADVGVITSEDPRNEDADAIIDQIAAGAEAAGATPERTLFRRTDRREAIRLAIDLAQPGDCLLLAGKGHEGSIIWGREKVPWDEAGVARELLAEAGYRREGG